MIPNLQPTLDTKNYQLVPLAKSDFEALYASAKDPETWSQHPNPNRYKREVFQNFFQGALQSGGAFKVVRKKDGVVLGSTRFYDYNPLNSEILIGYTFYNPKHWGQGVNREVKEAMLNYIFDFIDTVVFHVGRENERSKRAMEKLGALKRRELEVAYHGESPKINIEYEISKSSWTKRKSGS
ncbi:GNAT family N-acetyltransferase [Chryseobacterium sp. A321]